MYKMYVSLQKYGIHSCKSFIPFRVDAILGFGRDAKVSSTTVTSFWPTKLIYCRLYHLNTTQCLPPALRKNTSEDWTMKMQSVCSLNHHRIWNLSQLNRMPLKMKIITCFTKFQLFTQYKNDKYYFWFQQQKIHCQIVTAQPLTWW